MDPQPLLDTINHCTRLKPEEEVIIASKLTVRNFRKKEFLNAEGDINRYTNFLVRGSARTYYIDQDGYEHIVQLAIPGWWIGDYASFIMQEPGRMFTEALEPTSTLSISYDDLQWLFDQVPVMERFYRLLIQKAYSAFQTRVLHGLSFDAELRYRMFRDAYPAMDQQISQKHIASYLGMSPEFLSKVKKRLVARERLQKKKASG